MDIYHYHPETGVFLGHGQADESPLEPGVWLIPAYATTEQPLEPGDNEQVVWLGASWQLQSIPEPEPKPEPEPEPEPALPLKPPVLPSSWHDLTTEQKLESFGLTVAELRELFGLPEPG